MPAPLLTPSIFSFSVQFFSQWDQPCLVRLARGCTRSLARPFPLLAFFFGHQDCVARSRGQDWPFLPSPVHEAQDAQSKPLTGGAAEGHSLGAAKTREQPAPLSLASDCKRFL